MRARAPYLGDPGTFEAIVHDLVLDGASQVLTMDDDHLVVRGPTGVVIVARLGVAAEGPLSQLVERLQAAGVVVILAGGGVAEGEAVLAAADWSRYGWVSALHVADDGSIAPIVHEGPGAAVLGWLQARAPAAPDWERFWAVIGKQQALAAHADRLIKERLLSSTPWVSRTLVGAMALIFAVEAVLGADKNPEILVAMGALSAPLVAEGQAWRVLGATLLHGSFLHAAVNLYVLWRVGDLVERVVGHSRFLVIYVLAGVGGSMASMALPAHLSVGASGAIWGVMAAQLVLGLRGAGKLPEPLRRSMKVAAGQNLLLNLLISFLPGIDWAAHVGGGAVGALVTMALVGGLQAWPEPGAPSAPPPRLPMLVSVGAILGAMLLMGAALMVAVGAVIAAPLAGIGAVPG